MPAMEPSMSSPETPLEDFLPYILRRLTTLLNSNMIQDLKPYDINVSKWRVIAILHFCGECSVGELAQKTALTQPGTSQIIDKLVRDKIVERKALKDDNRIMQLSLTIKGQALFDNIYPIIIQHQDHLTRNFTEKEKETLINLCQKMLSNIK